MSNSAVSYKANLSFMAIVMTIIFDTTSLAYAENTISGYIKEDGSYLDGDYRLQRGEQIECTISDNKKECCFEEEIGTICIPRATISSSPVKKSDYSISDIVFADSDDMTMDACKTATPIAKRSDAFIWSYGFKINSNDKTREPVMVELTAAISSNDLALNSPLIMKRWLGTPDGQCKSLNITKADINKFLAEYHKISKYLQNESDLNLDAKISIKLFSSRKESNYENNNVEFSIMLPADNSVTWPPNKLR